MAASQEQRGRRSFAPTNRKLMAKNNQSEPPKKKNLPKNGTSWICADLPVRHDILRWKKTR